MIDRSQPLKDISKLSVHIPTIHDADDDWSCCIMLNRALLELRHQGGGPVHINLVTNYSPDFTVRELPKVPVIERICYGNAFPKLPVGRIGIYVGAHRKWSQELTKAVDDFVNFIKLLFSVTIQVIIRVGIGYLPILFAVRFNIFHHAAIWMS